MFDAPEIVFSTPDGVLATWHGVVIAVWRLHTRTEALLRMQALLRRVGLTHKDAALFQVVEPTCKPLDAEQRDALEQVLRGADGLRCSAVVYEGTGFQAAAVRAIVAGLSAMRRHAFPHRIFPDVAAAARFQANELRKDGEFSAALEAAIDDVRASVVTHEEWVPGASSWPPPAEKVGKG